MLGSPWDILLGQTVKYVNNRRSLYFVQAYIYTYMDYILFLIHLTLNMYMASDLNAYMHIWIIQIYMHECNKLYNLIIFFHNNIRK